MPSHDVFNINGITTEGYGMITLQELLLSKTLLLTEGAASHHGIQQDNNFQKAVQLL
jgi:hypothetical protein